MNWDFSCLRHYSSTWNKDCKISALMSTLWKWQVKLSKTYRSLKWQKTKHTKIRLPKMVKELKTKPNDFVLNVQMSKWINILLMLHIDIYFKKISHKVKGYNSGKIV